MPKNDELSFLERLSGAISGQTLTGGARALGEGIGYGAAGGDFGDIPQVMREALDEYNQRAAKQTKNEQDALAVASGLAAMSNPYSAIGHGIDFAAAVPDMVKYKLSDEEAPLGTVAESGLKRRLAKGGAQAKYALKQRASRIDNVAGDQTLRGSTIATHFGLPISYGGYNRVQKMSNAGLDALFRSQRPAAPIEELSDENAKFAKYLDAKKLNAPMEYHHTENFKLSPFYEEGVLNQIKTALPEEFEKAQKAKRPRKEPFAPVAKEAILPEGGQWSLKRKLNELKYQKIFSDPKLQEKYNELANERTQKDIDTYFKFNHHENFNRLPEYQAELEANAKKINDFVESIKIKP